MIRRNININSIQNIMKKQCYFTETKAGCKTEHREKSDLKAGVPAKTKKLPSHTASKVSCLSFATDAILLVISIHCLRIVVPASKFKATLRSRHHFQLLPSLCVLF